MRITELHHYPLKSGRGIALEAAEITATGIPGDRVMMVTDPKGQFLTQRDLQALAQVKAMPVDAAGKTTLAMDGHGSLDVRFETPDRRLDVVVWKSALSAALAPEAVNATLSEWLERDVRLVFFDARAHRTASVEWAGDNSPVTFADGYPLLITTTGSLAALNADIAAHGEEPVGMDRFRPNIVIDHDAAWAEDDWAAIEIGGIRFDLVKPCARCIMTTQDQKTGSRAVPSPMPAMGRLRMSGDRRVPGPLFGWNAVPRGTGRLALGDTARVLEDRAGGWTIKRRD
ncbi:MOSC domain-containing protein [Neorhizobium sp. NPDC001467]|uniref:MOSC domain-containing protein n=1 Tax=Neorhizobium sp. NPDC001467 TaxID=3390595 RepID=UPI003CFE1FF4